MEKQNHLSENLKAYQLAQGKSVAEMSKELGIAKSTVQSVMADGNTTLDTLIRLAGAMHMSLDELVFGERPAKQFCDIRFFLAQVGWYAGLPAEKQEKFLYHLFEMLRLLGYDK